MIDPIDNDPIDFTFADDGDLRRKAPRDKPEDPVEARLAREVEAAPYIAETVGLDGDPAVMLANVAKVVDRFTESRMKWQARMGMVAPFEKSDAVERGEAMHRAFEVKHGSGKVRV